jgi:NAD(P)-dependent dehydrogenase (short-subunit alcohol dehydrogenase family)
MMTPNQSWTVANMPDLTGRTIVVTGASSGIGTDASREFARAGARVVLAVRNVAKGEAAARTITGNTDVRELDLASLASIRAFADAVGDVDILVNNAGIMYAPKGLTADGFELHIGTNHLGHFALTNLLLDRLTDRVVTITSGVASRGKIDLNDLNWQRRTYKDSQAYADSKQANILFTLELQRRLGLAGRDVIAVAAHPGVAKTNLISHIGGFTGSATKFVVSLIGQDSAHGALPTLFAATEDIPGASLVGPHGIGHMRGYPALQHPPRSTLNAGVATRLWEISDQMTTLR